MGRWSNHKKLDLYNGNRICKICKEIFPITNFYMVGGKKDYKVRSTMCKKCFVACTTKYKLKNKEKYKLLDLKGQLKRKYGISLNDYKNLVKKSNNKCAICKNKINKKTLVLDHCHFTKKVRNILCRNCNLGLGSFKDNPTTLSNAIKYLKKHNT